MNIVIFFRDGDIKKQRNVLKIEHVYTDTDGIVITIEDGIVKNIYL